MEKIGIITGIGNIITPEIDAVINEYIINKNCIISGLGLYKTDAGAYALSAGMCIFDGYRGVLEQEISDVGEGSYIYAKFVLNFNEEVKDEFYIVVSEIEITTSDFVNGAGTYYMELYNGWAQSTIPTPSVSQIKYPYITEVSDKASNLTTITYPDGTTQAPTIGSSATTPTAEVNSHIEDSTKYRIVNAEYVHNQIQEELAVSQTTVPIYSIDSSTIQIGTMTLYRRGQVVWGTAVTTEVGYAQGTISFTLPEGYIPTEDTRILIMSAYNFFSQGPPSFQLVSYFIPEANATYTTSTIIDATISFASMSTPLPIGYKA